MSASHSVKTKQTRKYFVLGAVQYSTGLSLVHRRECLAVGRNRKTRVNCEAGPRVSRSEWPERRKLMKLMTRRVSFGDGAHWFIRTDDKLKQLSSAREYFFLCCFATTWKTNTFAPPAIYFWTSKWTVNCYAKQTIANIIFCCAEHRRLKPILKWKGEAQQSSRRSAANWSIMLIKFIRDYVTKRTWSASVLVLSYQKSRSQIGGALSIASRLLFGACNWIVA